MTYIPPHDLNAEAAVLSAVLIDPAALDQVAGELRPEHFYSEAHRRIFEAALALAKVGKPVDVVQVASQLAAVDRIAHVGGMGYLTEILNSAPAVVNVAAYGQTVIEKWRLRQAIRVCQYFAAEAYMRVDDVGAFMDRLEQAIYEVARAGSDSRSGLETMRDAAHRAFQKLSDAAKRGPGAITGTPTGFSAIDAAMAGLHDGDLTVIAGRPGMGKTGFVMNVAANIATAKAANDELVGNGVLVFSLEMPNEQIATRALCSEAEVDLRKARTGMFTPHDWSRLTSAAQRVCAPKHFYVDESPAITITAMRSKVRAIQAQLAREGRRLAVVAVDYLQLMKRDADATTREEAVSEISRGLKALAKEMRVPVVALSSLNRAVEQRSDKRPMMGDLRESGAIESDADNVLLLYRDDYYNADSKTPGVTEIIIAKQRNGPTGTVCVGFKAQSTKFFNLEEDAHGQAA